MLTQLNVRDFAIVEAAEIALGAGLTVVSGETGAGKSLLVDALLLLSGARADSLAVRAGCERAELSATFEIAALPPVQAWLAENDLDDGPECLLRRVIRAEGPSRAWINGRPVTMQMLADVASRLVEIHGQHEHQALLDRARQLELLDAFGQHGELVATVAHEAAQWHELERQRHALSQRTGDDGERTELLRHHLRELQGVVLTAEALQSLETEHRRLAHQGESAEACANARALLDGEHESALLPTLARARHLIEQAQRTDSRLADIVSLLESATVELREAAGALDAYLDGVDLDPARLQQVEAQLTRLHDLARKHRVPAADLAARRDAIEQELAAAENADATLAQLADRQRVALDAWRSATDRLSAARTRTADRLGRDVTGLMAELGMAGGRFDIALEPITSTEPDRQGRERAEFQVSANPGQPPRPLRKVASGGELSRIALALEVAAIGNDPVPTMVFDEVDSGVGGAVAEILGQKLRRLGHEAQVLCVTHLPQVAAQGHAHLRVHKEARQNRTRTLVTALSEHERVQEIARMLGGLDITDTTLAHARQMLARVG